MTLTCQNGRRVRCKAVIVTVPIRILQDNVISFNPPLPAPKQGALQRIKMGNVIKVRHAGRGGIYGVRVENSHEGA